jgi:hypothetical protein
VNMVMTNDGKKRGLDLFFGRAADYTENFTVELYQNNYTPVDGSVTADFTAATFTGYSAVTITNGGFAAATIVSSEGNATYTPAPSFTCTGGSSQTVYGWFLRGATSGKTYFAQKFTAARVMVAGAVEALDPFTFKDKSFA